MSSQGHGALRQIDGPARGARFLLFAYVALNVVAVVSSALQYQLLDQFERGLYTDQDLAIADADSNDARQQLIGIAQVILYLITAIVFLVWTYRVAWNARHLDSDKMQIRAGWAVCWYFIPIAFLWMPYRAITQVWSASSRSEDRGFLLVWWLFFIADNILGQIIFRMGMVAETLPALKSLTVLFIVSDIVSSVAAILCARVVARVSNAQNAAIAAETLLQARSEGTATTASVPSVPGAVRSE
jgi:hypothetical protein